MLTFHLKKEWFEKIKSGEKTHEYRVANKYWNSRLLKLYNEYKLKGTGIPCCFSLGYPRRNDTTKRVYGYITHIQRLCNGLDTDLKIDKPVFDIEFELIKGVQDETDENTSDCR